MAADSGTGIAVTRAGLEDMQLIRTMFLEYAEWLGIDLGFQGFREEIDGLPGKYGAPKGRILLAHDLRSHDIAGCVALRPHTDSRCEMKRLWVRERFRGRGMGIALVDEIVEAARTMGYKEMVLDTLESMIPALRLYSRCGFTRIPPYYHNPLPGAVYLGRNL
jgi:ribosomal protein S18 acetylase RimI-like enzyme